MIICDIYITIIEVAGGSAEATKAVCTKWAVITVARTVIEAAGE